MMNFAAVQKGTQHLKRVLLRWLRREGRKIISSILVVTFTCTMTGLDTLVASVVRAEDRTPQQRHQDSGFYKAPLNPVAETLATQAFTAMPASLQPGHSAPVLSDTRINVIRASFGPALDAGALRTVAEKVTSGMSVVTAVADHTAPVANLRMQPAAAQPVVAASATVINPAVLGRGMWMMPAERSTIGAPVVAAAVVVPQTGAPAATNWAAMKPADAGASMAAMKPADAGKILGAMPPDQSSKILAAMPPDQASKVIAAMPPDQASKVIGAMPPDQASKVMAAMPPDQASKVMAAMPPDQAGKVMAAMPPDQAGKVMAAMPPDQAGKVMAAMPPDQAGKIVAAMPPDQAGKIMAAMKPEEAGKVLDTLKPADAAKVLTTMKPEDTGKILSTMKPEDAGKILGAMKPEDAGKVLKAMKPEDAGKVLGAMKPEDAGKVLAAMKPEDAGKIVGAMKPEDAGKVMAAMKPEDAGKVLGAMKPEDAAKVAGAMKPEDAGKIMAAMKPDAAGKIIAAMKPEDAGKILKAMKPEDAGKVLKAMKPEDAGKVLTAMKPEDAGKIVAGMKTEDSAKILATMKPADSAKITAASAPAPATGTGFAAGLLASVGAVAAAVKSAVVSATGAGAGAGTAVAASLKTATISVVPVTQVPGSSGQVRLADVSTGTQPALLGSGTAAFRTLSFSAPRPVVASVSPAAYVTTVQPQVRAQVVTAVTKPNVTATSALSVQNTGSWYQLYDTATGKSTPTTGPVSIVSVVASVASQVSAPTARIAATPHVAAQAAPAPAAAPAAPKKTSAAAPTDPGSQGVSGERTHQKQKKDDNQNAHVSGCAKFMGSFLGKCLMFLISVVAIVFSPVGMPLLLLIIMIILVAITTFVPMPAGLAIALSILTIAIGGWGAGISAAAGTATQAGMAAFITASGGLLRTLANPTVLMSIIKAVIAKIIVMYIMSKLKSENPVLNTLIAVCAGIAAGAMAQGITNTLFGGNFLTGMKDGFIAAVREAVGLGPRPVSFFASPLFLAFSTVIIQVEVQKVLDAHMSPADSTFISNLIGTAAAGAMAFTASALAPVETVSGQNTLKTTFQLFNTYVTNRLIVDAAQSAFTCYVAPVLEQTDKPEGERDHPYSTYQVQDISGNIGAFFGGLLPGSMTGDHSMMDNIVAGKPSVVMSTAVWTPIPPKTATTVVQTPAAAQVCTVTPPAAPPVAAAAVQPTGAPGALAGPGKLELTMPSMSVSPFGLGFTGNGSGSGFGGGSGGTGPGLFGAGASGGTSMTLSLDPMSGLGTGMTGVSLDIPGMLQVAGSGLSVDTRPATLPSKATTATTGTTSTLASTSDSNLTTDSSAPITQNPQEPTQQAAGGGVASSPSQTSETRRAEAKAAQPQAHVADAPRTQDAPRPNEAPAPKAPDQAPPVQQAAPNNNDTTHQVAAPGNLRPDQRLQEASVNPVEVHVTDSPNPLVKDLSTTLKPSNTTGDPLKTGRQTGDVVTGAQVTTSGGGTANGGTANGGTANGGGTPINGPAVSDAAYLPAAGSPVATKTVPSSQLTGSSQFQQLQQTTNMPKGTEVQQATYQNAAGQSVSVMSATDSGGRTVLSIQTQSGSDSGTVVNKVFSSNADGSDASLKVYNGQDPAPVKDFKISAETAQSVLKGLNGGGAPAGGAAAGGSGAQRLLNDEKTAPKLTPQTIQGAMKSLVSGIVPGETIAAGAAGGGLAGGTAGSASAGNAAAGGAAAAGAAAAGTAAGSVPSGSTPNKAAGSPAATTAGAPATSAAGAPAVTAAGAPATTATGAPATSAAGAPATSAAGAPATSAAGAPATSAAGAPAATAAGAPSAKSSLATTAAGAPTTLFTENTATRAAGAPATNAATNGDALDVQVQSSSAANGKGTVTLKVNGEDVTMTYKYDQNSARSQVVDAKDPSGKYVYKLNADAGGNIAPGASSAEGRMVKDVKPMSGLRQFFTHEAVDGFQANGSNLAVVQTGRGAEAYSPDGSGAKVMDTYKAQGSDGHTYAAMLPVSTPPELRQAAVMAAQGSPEALQNNPDFLMEAFKSGKYAGTPEFEAMTKARAEDARRTAPADVYKAINSLPPEVRQTPMANNLLAKADIMSIENNNRAGPTGSQVTALYDHAFKSQDPGMIQQAGNFLGKIQNQPQMVATAAQVLTASQSQSTPVQADVAFGVAQTLQTAGRTDSPVFQDALAQASAQYTQMAYNGPVTGQSLAQAAQVNAMLQKAGEPPSVGVPMNTMADQLTSQVAPHLAELSKPGSSVNLGNGAVMTKTADGTLVIQQKTPDATVVTTTLNVKGAQVTLDRVDVSDAKGPKEAYTNGKQGLTLTAERITVQATVACEPVSVNVMMPTSGAGKMAGLVEKNGQVFAVMVDIETRQVTGVETAATKPLVPPALTTANAQGAFVWVDGVPRSLSGQPVKKFDHMTGADITAAGASLLQAGASQAQVDQMLGGLAGQTVYQVGATLYVGTAEAIQAGNYQTIGVNTFGAEASPLMYTATYAGGSIQSAKLSDGRLLNFQHGNPQTFTVTLTEGMRTYQAQYVNGQLTGSSLTLRDMNGTLHYDAQGNLTKASTATLRYDAQGNLTAESMTALRAAGREGQFNFREVSGGFVLSFNGHEAAFTTTGRAMQVPGGGGAGGDQKVLEYDITQKLTLNFAKYNDVGGVSVTLDNTKKETVVVRALADGGLSRTTTTSNGLGQIQSSITLNYAGAKIVNGPTVMDAGKGFFIIDNLNGTTKLFNGASMTNGAMQIGSNNGTATIDKSGNIELTGFAILTNENMKAEALGGTVKLNADHSVELIGGAMLTNGEMVLQSLNGSARIDAKNNVTLEHGAVLTSGKTMKAESLDGVVKLNADHSVELTGGARLASGDMRLESRNGTANIDDKNNVTLVKGAVLISGKMMVESFTGIAQLNADHSMTLTGGARLTNGNMTMDSLGGEVIVDAKNNVTLKGGAILTNGAMKVESLGGVAQLNADKSMTLTGGAKLTNGKMTMQSLGGMVRVDSHNNVTLTGGAILTNGAMKVESLGGVAQLNADHSMRLSGGAKLTNGAMTMQSRGGVVFVDAGNNVTLSGGAILTNANVEEKDGKRVVTPLLVESAGGVAKLNADKSMSLTGGARLTNGEMKMESLGGAVLVDAKNNVTLQIGATLTNGTMKVESQDGIAKLNADHSMQLTGGAKLTNGAMTLDSSNGIAKIDDHNNITLGKGAVLTNGAMKVESLGGIAVLNSDKSMTLSNGAKLTNGPMILDSTGGIVSIDKGNNISLYKGASLTNGGMRVEAKGGLAMLNADHSMVLSGGAIMVNGGSTFESRTGMVQIAANQKMTLSGTAVLLNDKGAVVLDATKGTVSMENSTLVLNGVKVTTQVVSQAGASSVVINGKQLQVAVGEGVELKVVTEDGIQYIQLSDDGHQVMRFNASGDQQTSAGRRMANTFFGSLTAIGNSFGKMMDDSARVNSLEDAGERHMQNFQRTGNWSEYWAGVKTNYQALAARGQVGLDALSVIGNAAMGVVNTVLSPITGGLSALADNVYKPIAEDMSNPAWLRGAAAFYYGSSKFIANNLVILTLVVAGFVTAGTTWAPLVAMAGHLFIGASALSSLDKGIVNGLILTFAKGFFLQPFIEFGQGVSALWNSHATAIQIADGLVLTMSGALGVYFTAKMVDGWTGGRVSGFVSDLVLDVSLRFNNAGAIDLTKASPEVRAAAEVVADAKGLSLGEKVDVIRDLVNGEPIEATLAEAGLKMADVQVTAGLEMGEMKAPAALAEVGGAEAPEISTGAEVSATADLGARPSLEAPAESNAGASLEAPARVNAGSEAPGTALEGLSGVRAPVADAVAGTAIEARTGAESGVPSELAGPTVSRAQGVEAGVEARVPANHAAGVETTTKSPAGETGLKVKDLSPAEQKGLSVLESHLSDAVSEMKGAKTASELIRGSKAVEAAAGKLATGLMTLNNPKAVAAFLEKTAASGEKTMTLGAKALESMVKLTAGEGGKSTARGADVNEVAKVLTERGGSSLAMVEKACRALGSDSRAVRAMLENGNIGKELSGRVLDYGTATPKGARAIAGELGASTLKIGEGAKAQTAMDRAAGSASPEGLGRLASAAADLRTTAAIKGSAAGRAGLAMERLMNSAAKDAKVMDTMVKTASEGGGEVLRSNMLELAERSDAVGEAMGASVAKSVDTLDKFAGQGEPQDLSSLVKGIAADPKASETLSRALSPAEGQKGLSSKAQANLTKALQNEFSENPKTMTKMLDNLGSNAEGMLERIGAPELMREMAPKAAHELAQGIKDMTNAQATAAMGKTIEGAMKLSGAPEAETGLNRAAGSGKLVESLQRFVDAAEKAQKNSASTQGEGAGTGGKGGKADNAPKDLLKTGGRDLLGKLANQAVHPLRLLENVFGYASGMKVLEKGFESLGASSARRAEARETKRMAADGEYAANKLRSVEAKLEALDSKATAAFERTGNDAFSRSTVNKAVETLQERATLAAQKDAILRGSKNTLTQAAAACAAYNAKDVGDLAHAMGEAFGEAGQQYAQSAKAFEAAKAKFERSAQTGNPSLSLKAAAEVLQAKDALAKSEAALRNHPDAEAAGAQTFKAALDRMAGIETKMDGLRYQEWKLNQEIKMLESHPQADQAELPRLRQLLAKVEFRMAEAGRPMADVHNQVVRAADMLGQHSALAAELLAKGGELSPVAELMERASATGRQEILQAAGERANAVIGEMTPQGRNLLAAELTEPQVKSFVESRIEAAKTAETDVAKGRELLKAMDLIGQQPVETMLKMLENPDLAKAAEMSQSPALRMAQEISTKTVADAATTQLMQEYKAFRAEHMGMSEASALEWFNTHQNAGKTALDAKYLKAENVITVQALEAVKKIIALEAQSQKLEIQGERARTAGDHQGADKFFAKSASLQKEVISLSAETAGGKLFDALPNTRTVIKAAEVMRAEGIPDMAIKIGGIMEAKSVQDFLKFHGEHANMTAEAALDAFNKLPERAKEPELSMQKIMEVKAVQEFKSFRAGHEGMTVEAALEAFNKLPQRAGQLELNKGTLSTAKTYEEARANAAVTEMIEIAWIKEYRGIYQDLGTEGRAQYLAKADTLRQTINDALDNGNAEGKVLDGKALFEKFNALRQQMIESGQIKRGSVDDARLIRVYGEVAFQRVTGYPSMRVAQQIMLSEFFGGRNAGLEAGGGKTNPFIMFPGETRLMSGEALRAEILVDDGPAIDKYLNEPQKNGLVQGDLARAFGIELKNGNALYAEAQKTGNFKGLIDALHDPNAVVIFDHTTRGHLRNAEVTNPQLRAALGETNLVGIDEVHMAATSQTSAIIGGNIKAPDVRLVRQIDRLMNDLGFDFAKYQTSSGPLVGTPENPGRVAFKGGFEIKDLRGTLVTDQMATEYNSKGVLKQKLIILTDDGPKLNEPARTALDAYTSGEISSTLKTIFSEVGKGNEYSSYAVKDGLIFPVDNLGKIQFEQISNDIVGQITASRLHNFDPFTSVRVNETSMQTSLSAMYAGNTGAQIVGASGTISGIESLMESKIGSSATHISTSVLDLQKYVFEKGGRILTDSAEADNIVINSVKGILDGLGGKSRNALVFESNPKIQLEKALEYLQKLTGISGDPAVVGVMGAESVGYYTELGKSSPLMEKLLKSAQADAGKLELEVNVAKAEVRELPGGAGIERTITFKDGQIKTETLYSADVREINGVKVQYVKIMTESIQTMVANTGRIANQVVMFNEQGAVGKNFQADLTLVARDGQKLTSDMMTQLLLRSGRPGGEEADGRWATQRFILVNPMEVYGTLDTALNKSTEVGGLWKEGSGSRALLDEFSNKPELRAELVELDQLSKLSERSPEQQARLQELSESPLLNKALTFVNEFRQLQLVGDSTRFAVQDTFHDRIVIDPLKQAMRTYSKETQAGKILDNEMTRVLNSHATDADVSLRLESTKDSKTLNQDYVRSNFFTNIGEARTAWQNIKSNTSLVRSLFNPEIRALRGLATETLRNLNEQAKAVESGKTLTGESKSFAEAKSFSDLFRIGQNLMENVLSRDAGGAPAAGMRVQIDRVAEAAKAGQAISPEMQTSFEKAWTASHDQIKAVPNLTPALAASLLQTDEDAARLAMAPTAAQALKALQITALANNNPDLNISLGDRAQFNLNLPSGLKVPTLGTGKIAAFLQKIPGVAAFQAQSAEVQRALAGNAGIAGDAQVWTRTEAYTSANPAAVARLKNEGGAQWFSQVVATALGPDGQKWAAAHPMEVKGMQASFEKYGEQWAQPALAAKYGADWKFLQQMAQIRWSQASSAAQTNVVGKVVAQLAQLRSLPMQIWLISRQASRAQALYTQLGQAAEQLQAAFKDSGNTVYFQGRVLGKAEARAEQVRLQNLAADLGQRYGFEQKPSEQRAGQSVWSRAIPTLAGGLAAAAMFFGSAGSSAAATLAQQVGGRMAPQTSIVDSLVGVKSLADATSRGAVQMAAPASAQSQGATLFQQWQQRLGGSRSSDKAVEVLTSLLGEQGVKLLVGAPGKSYAHMDLVATLVTLLETGLRGTKVTLSDVFKSINVADSQVMPNSLVIPKDAAGFFVTNRFIRAFMNQVSLSLATELGKNNPKLIASLSALKTVSMFQTEELQRDPSLLPAEFIRNYMLKGESLRAQINALPKGTEKTQLLTAYAALKTALGGKVYNEADLTDLSNAILTMENDGGQKMALAAGAIAQMKDKSERTLAEQQFQMQFGPTLAEYRQMEAKPLGLRIMESGLFQSLTQADNLKNDPYQATNRASVRFAGTGAALGILAIGAAFVAWPVALALGAVGAGALGISGILGAQRDAIAWKTNPAASVMHALESGQFSPEVRQALLHNDQFMLAVGGLRVPGTRQMVSEENLNDAICLAMNTVGARIAASGSVAAQADLTRQLVGVLQTLHFNVTAEVRNASERLDIQLTPTVQPTQALVLNNRFIRSMQMLNYLGVNLHIPAQWQQEKPLKLKTSDSAA